MPDKKDGLNLQIQMMLLYDYSDSPVNSFITPMTSNVY